MAEQTIPRRRSDTDPAFDPARPYDVGMRLRDDDGSYVGDIEVTSLPNGRPPTLRVTVVAENMAVATLTQKLRPDELRELAGALERAADHSEAGGVVA